MKSALRIGTVPQPRQSSAASHWISSTAVGCKLGRGAVPDKPNSAFVESLRLVTHGLDVVTVRIEHERAVVVGVVVGPQTWRAVVPAARRNGGLVKGVHRGARGHAKCNVEGRIDRIALADPKIGSICMAEASTLFASGRCTDLGQPRVAGRCKRRQVESLAS